MSFDSGKRLALIALAASILIALLDAVAWTVFGLSDMSIPIALFSTIMSILSLASFAFLITRALGHFIMFSRQRNLLDLVSSVVIIISVVLNLLNNFVLMRILPYEKISQWSTVYALLQGAIFSVYPLSLSMKQRGRNNILSLLLGCAFLYHLIIAALISSFLMKLGVNAFYSNAATNVLAAGCTGLYFLSVLSERESSY